MGCSGEAHAGMLSVESASVCVSSVPSAVVTSGVSDESGGCGRVGRSARHSSPCHCNNTHTASMLSAREATHIARSPGVVTMTELSSACRVVSLTGGLADRPHSGGCCQLPPCIGAAAVGAAVSAVAATGLRTGGGHGGRATRVSSAAAGPIRSSSTPSAAPVNAAVTAADRYPRIMGMAARAQWATSHARCGRQACRDYCST